MPEIIAHLRSDEFDFPHRKVHVQEEHEVGDEEGDELVEVEVSGVEDVEERPGLLQSVVLLEQWVDTFQVTPEAIQIPAET